MATDLQIKQQRAELRKRFFMLLQNEVPEGFDRNQVEKDLRELAAGLVLKGVIDKEKWEAVIKLKDHNKQLLEAIELVLSAADENKDEAPGVRMEQLVEELKQHQEILRKQAEQKAAKQPSPHEQAEKIIAAQARAYRRLQQDNPLAAEAFQEIQEEISTGLVNNPGTTLPAANQYVAYVATRDNPSFTTTDASVQLSSIVEPARDFSQPIDTLVEQIVVSLPPSIKNSVREEIAQAIVSFKLTVPNATREDYKPLLEKIELDQAARNQTAVSLPPEVADTAIAAKIDYGPNEIIQETIKAKLQQAGIPEADSQKVAQVITNFAPAIHYVSSFAPSKTPQEYEKNKKEVTQKLTNHVVDRLLMSPSSPRSLLQALKNTSSKFDFYKLYTTAYGPAQFYQYKPELYDYPSRPDVHTNDPYLTYLASYTRDTVKDAAVGVALDWVVAGPIGGWILPDAALASAFVFDAGITAAPAAAGAVAATAAPVAATVGAEVAATAAGATATGTATGGALGSWLGPAGIAIGAAIGAIVGWLVKNKDKIWKWLKDNIGPILVGLTVGAVAIVGALVAGLAGLGVAAVGLLGFGTGVILAPQAGVLVSAGPAAALQPIAAGASKVLANLTELAVVEIATPLIAIILAIPVVVALLLFIITNSAYVVPPSATDVPGFIPGQGGFEDNASCPVTGGAVHAGSYNPNTQTGHGGNVYWSPATGVGGTSCRYSLPQQTGCRAPTVGSDNVCYKQSNLSRCDFYGFSADIFPPTAGSLAPVYLPLINGQEVSWSYNGTFFPNGGGLNGYSYGFTDTTGKYSILFTHVQTISNPALLTNVKSGTQAAKLYNQNNNTHLHLEFQVDGVYQRPENYFCGTTP